MENSKSITYTIRLKKDLYADLVSLAISSHTTMSHIINYALADYLIDCRNRRALLKDYYANQQID